MHARSPLDLVSERDTSRRPFRRSLALVVVLTLAGVPISGCKLAANTSRSTRAQPAETTVTTVRATTLEADSPAPSPESSPPPSTAFVESTTVVEQSVPTESFDRPVEVAQPPATTRPPVRVEGGLVASAATVRPIPTGATPRQVAIEILMNSSRSQWPQMRANAMEALIPDPRRLRGEVVAGLVDENRGVRFVALMSMYEAKLCELIPMAEDLLQDPSDSVRAAAILALRSCGHNADPSPLARMAGSDDPEVRANAFVILGLLGNPSAEVVIRNALGTSMGLVNPSRARIVELQGAAALVRLGDEEEIQPIRAALFTPSEQGELILLAIQALAELGDAGAKGMLVRLVEAPGNQTRPPEIRLAAATALAQLGLQEPAPYLRLVAEYAASPDPAVRAQVAALLGFVPSETGTTVLANLMQDSSSVVRLAAAGSIVRLSAATRLATPAEATVQVGSE